VNYLFYRRIKGPIFLLTFGFTAILATWHILSFGRSWPIYLIVWGILRLLEGAAFATASSASPYLQQGYPPQGSGYQPGSSYPGYGTAGFQPGAPGPSAPGTGLATVAPAYIEPATGYTPLPEEKQ
jgi:hypothetical protein